MNHRPILIATSIAIALVAFVYLIGKQHFSPSRVSAFGRSTVDTPESPSNAAFPLKGKAESEKRVDSTVDRSNTATVPTRSSGDFS